MFSNIIVAIAASVGNQTYADGQHINRADDKHNHSERCKFKHRKCALTQIYGDGRIFRFSVWR